MSKLLSLFAGLAAVSVLVLTVSPSPVTAKPGWSMENHTVLGLTEEQRDYIDDLRSAYRERIGELDWAVTEDGHPPETLQEARELRAALRAEIREVLTDEQREAMKGKQAACPHSGQRGSQTRQINRSSGTLYL